MICGIGINQLPDMDDKPSDIVPRICPVTVQVGKVSSVLGWNCHDKLQTGTARFTETLQLIALGLDTLPPQASQELPMTRGGSVFIKTVL